MADKRNDVYESIKGELYGPSDYTTEEVLIDTPINRYFCGVLNPREIPSEEEDLGDPTPEDGEGIGTDEGKEKTKKGLGASSLYDLSDEEEEDLNLSNAFKQSALSLTFGIKPTDSIILEVGFAFYVNTERSKFVRKPHLFVAPPISVADLLKDFTAGKSYHKVIIDDGTRKLDLRLYRRWRQRDAMVFTASVVNDSKKKSIYDCERTFFQVELRVKSSLGFVPLMRNVNLERADEDRINNELLYRKQHKYAEGHGCSPYWDVRSSGDPKEINSSFLPWYELQAVIPHGTGLSMRDFIESDSSHIFGILDGFLEEYGVWIEEQKAHAKNELGGGSLFEQASKNILRCIECYKRIKAGIEVLKNDKTALKAFRLMNKAMLLQQIRSKLSLRKLILQKGSMKFSPLQKDSEVIPEPTHFNGRWRAFQIGFVLLALKGIVEIEDKDRTIIDLIWFPTGGGKTEAYLGLSAFTLIYNRLTKRDDGTCTQIFMRYTLRLLTSQQYQRAASLICALEYMRRKEAPELGEVPFSIGLWVGNASTPNTKAEAVKKLADIHNGEEGRNPFIVTKCPWCGCELGPSGKGSHPYGYKKVTPLSGRGKTVAFGCENPECEFHAERLADVPKVGLPLKVIDEEIYEFPPSILIGTVDKFAMIPFKPSARSIFGLQNGAKSGRQHPQLVIQDELHLINGPLGSAVGCYETMFDALCSYEGDDIFVRPKIVASTATISQAREQCRSLFNVDPSQVNIFPIAAMDANETYFSTIDNEEPGRRYVGVYAPAAQSSSTASIHFLAAAYMIRHTVNWSGFDVAKDAYYTNVCYFNAIRELAQAKTWENADVDEAVRRIYKRLYPESFLKPEFNSIEMNSRNGDQDIGEYLRALETKLPDPETLDFVYTTNMFSVGVDIDRLGLMTVFGQPKTVSEYIQATSRVGRRTDERPGIVFTLYNASRPRDKSIFESFEYFHSRFYASVEPMSITPFSPQMRKKAIPALLVAIANGLSPNDCRKDIQPLFDDGYFGLAKKLILERVSGIDNSEYIRVEDQIDKILKRWEKNEVHVTHHSVGTKDFFDGGVLRPTPAIIAEGSTDLMPDVWKGIVREVPTSMRNVDQSCRMTIKDTVGGGEDE